MSYVVNKKFAEGKNLNFEQIIDFNSKEANL
jgi:hypothetical protein